jgi:AcrR family transcriptional regulator
MDKKSTREKLLQTAALEFSRLGYSKTNVNEVSVRAGFGKGTIYNYFENKFDLFISVFRGTMEQISTEIRSRISGIADPVEKLKMAIMADFSWFEDNRNLTLMMLRESYSADRNQQDQFMDAGRPLFQLFGDLIREGIDAGCYRQDIDPTLATIQLIGMSENLILLQGLTTPPLGSADELAQAVVDLFLNGIHQS